MAKLDGPGERIAKMIANRGYCSRREAERLIEQGKVRLNGKLIDTPALKVTEKDQIEINGTLLKSADATRLWIYHKPSQIMVTDKDPEGRTTLFQALSSNPKTSERRSLQF